MRYVSTAPPMDIGADRWRISQCVTLQIRQFDPRLTRRVNFDPTGYIFASLGKMECAEAMFYLIAGDILIIRILNNFRSADMVSDIKKTFKIPYDSIFSLGFLKNGGKCAF